MFWTLEPLLPELLGSDLGLGQPLTDQALSPSFLQLAHIQVLPKSSKKIGIQRDRTGKRNKGFYVPLQGLLLKV